MAVSGLAASGGCPDQALPNLYDMGLMALELYFLAKSARDAQRFALNARKPWPRLDSSRPYKGAKAPGTPARIQELKQHLGEILLGAHHSGQDSDDILALDAVLLFNYDMLRLQCCFDVKSKSVHVQRGEVFASSSCIVRASLYINIHCWQDDMCEPSNTSTCLSHCTPWLLI